jgi:hypothetical protein
VQSSAAKPKYKLVSFSLRFLYVLILIYWPGNYSVNAHNRATFPFAISLERDCEAEPERLNLLGAFLRRVLVT